MMFLIAGLNSWSLVLCVDENDVARLILRFKVRVFLNHSVHVMPDVSIVVWSVCVWKWGYV